jgi:hypothetical protein
MIVSTLAMAHGRPNQAVERTGKKLALFPRRSPLALGSLILTEGRSIRWRLMLRLG